MISTDSIGTGVRVQLTDVFGTSVNAFVTEGTTIASTNATGISGTGESALLQVAGHVHGAEFGIQLGNSPTLDAGTTVSILSTGVVSANVVAIRIEGVQSLVVNYGMITGTNGVSLSGNSSFQTSAVENYGTISVEVFALDRDGSGTETIRLENHGLIRAFGILDVSGAIASEQIVNTGQMSGELNTGGGNDRFDNRDGVLRGDVDMGDDVDVIDNRGGRITGDVVLGEGIDSFDNRGGTLDGAVFCGDGNDLVKVGRTEPFLYGGDGQDTLAFSGSAISIALDGAFDSSPSIDTIIILGFEHIGGTSFGDRLGGDALANELSGAGGADRLFGGGGADSLYGGRGVDVLQGGAGTDSLFGDAGLDRQTGGTGNDSFVFTRVTEFGDSIADFRNASGNNDRIYLFSDEIAGLQSITIDGAVSAALFRSRADNRAQDADDRFIYRTSDTTLWYDRDGNGSAGPVLLADLQPGVTLTRQDIYIEAVA
jgi:Ca2+-binding RTX toxin-like protein